MRTSMMLLALVLGCLAVTRAAGVHATPIEPMRYPWDVTAGALCDHEAAFTVISSRL